MDCTSNDRYSRGVKLKDVLLYFKKCASFYPFLTVPSVLKWRNLNGTCLFLKCQIVLPVWAFCYFRIFSSVFKLCVFCCVVSRGNHWDQKVCINELLWANISPSVISVERTIWFLSCLQAERCEVVIPGVHYTIISGI